MPRTWNKKSWKAFTALQQPDWQDREALENVGREIGEYPPLVFAGEIRNLKKRLKQVARGEAFILQAGDCAETFRDCKASTIRETLKVILQMAIILTYAGEKPLVKIGRIAGQYAKPRSSDFEKVNGVALPSYRGDIVNRNEPTAEARRANPENLRTAYYKAACTLNLLRGYTRGGFASLHNIHRWNLEFLEQTKEGERFERMAGEIDKALAFMKAINLNEDWVTEIKEARVYTSHEALILEYEEALTRKDTMTGEWYDCSAHMVWIGDRTRRPEGAHVEFLSGVNNPIGVKIGPEHDLDEVLKLVEKLNPENEAGKICLITRMGREKISEKLPGIVREIARSGSNVIWCCDPMHGNTFKSGNYKTRSMKDVSSEVKSFFQIMQAENAVPGGVHIELTGLNVTECIGGDVDEADLCKDYATFCDPRLNCGQSVELAFAIAEMIRSK